MTKQIETLVLGGGCFWCTEAIYKRLNGVVKVTPGYSGGSLENPDYETVCTGTSGHAEVIKIEFNPEEISFDKLLEIFWEIHDPTSINKQGNDVGTQYRSVIFYTNENQKNSVEKSKNELEKIGKKVVTEIKPLDKFYPAEQYHYDYFTKNKFQPYCSLVIAPKMKHFEEKFKTLIKN